jgi:UDP-glucose 4-epimerase
LELKNLRILVTGGAGFIGSHLVDRLLEMDNSVVVYDNFDDFYPGKESNVQHNLKNSRFKLMRDDILNYETLVSAMKGVAVVFHEAAQCGVRYCIKKPLKADRVNVTGTMNVLWAARQAKVRKIVFASSSGIFGEPYYVPMDEKHPTNPNSPYGVSKLAAEHYCLVFHKVYGLDVACLRYFSVYGPRGRPDQVIYKFASAIEKNEDPVIFGDGNQTRDFTFVSDVVDATLLAAECDDVGGEIFNIGYGREFSVNAVLDMIVENLNLKGKVEPIYKETYKGEFPRTFADNSKARKILRWKPKVELKRGINIFIKWFKEVQRPRF